MSAIRIQLLHLYKLKPHEKIIKKHEEKLLKEILKDNAIATPIIVAKKSSVILDGHHRVSVAKRIGLVTIPSIVVDYFDDKMISVFSRRKDIPVNKSLVIYLGTTGKLLPNKSTKHVLHVKYESRSYLLEDLS